MAEQRKVFLCIFRDDTRYEAESAMKVIHFLKKKWIKPNEDSIYRTCDRMELGQSFVCAGALVIRINPVRLEL